VVSGFHREGDKNRTLLNCYAARSGNSLPTFRTTSGVSDQPIQIVSKRL